MQRRFERAMPELEFPTRYALDEARFPGGRTTIRNEKEEDPHEPTAHFT